MVRSTSDTSICIVQPAIGIASETFIRAHAERLPGLVTVVHGGMPHIGQRAVVSRALPQRAMRKVWRWFHGYSYDEEVTGAFSQAFRVTGADVVLAEYGPMGVHVLSACNRVGVPLVVHFHGYDASDREVLAANATGYRLLFDRAKYIVVVSQRMNDQLTSLGAPADKVVYNPYGVDCDLFRGATPSAAAPTLLAVGRFVEKKAPHSTISAFAMAREKYPDAKLRMIGDGPLLPRCRELAGQLGIERAVEFLGTQSPFVIRDEMSRARAFVQHSVESPTGDCEGLPNSVLEAGAAGLPVIATRHAGIPEAVIDGDTGLLVDEHDVDGMAAHMQTVLHEPAFAGHLGASARRHIATNFSIEKSIAGLWTILRLAADLTPRETRHRVVGTSGGV